ncbi:BppU family phage baseplate upper protein [Clostridium botulinum]|uniref:BppU family phage baseplate upper protein n=1 Tax=Clostridium botulinum TaxID=1491 RepID=UPI0013759F5A|nr:BppU family phage baseplate upper protein [Clostridium botulinum]MCJ8173982.1 BppU family phage baseplate upper protein [Clostridium botulinum]NCI21998.1 BppU family phage baseplate upper protein [Clostridium botulinum]NCI37751.1 BppU family phage baseplate upper protein [Clostridium botulinum]NCI74323.1 BppU family phage baseplate upper protein [Clostridium botulinum]NDI40573.1 BppU family phage baseplate upper protein [Clostridium botulinum]
MDKPFNLLIDTKRTGFNAVRGLKQGDNNSVLNITLVQNSVPFNLTGLTVRMNYKRPDSKIFLQMADITNVTEGKIKINILTKALESIGEVKADLSIFDKDNRKITSATFSMFVDSSVYRNDYLEPEDLDLIQSIWVEEDKRIKQENIREKNEESRVSNESIREKNEKDRTDKEHLRQVIEDQRQDNEAGRESNENKRVENEKTRLENESKRAENEENRIAEETKRVEAEEERKTNETTRQQGYEEIKNTIDDFSVCEEFDLTKEYKKYNRVVYNGSCCECLKDCTNIYPVNKEYWICIATKGKDGLGSGNMHTDTYDKNQNGIVDKAESITDGFITYNVTDINNTLSTLNANDQYAREEIMDIKLKLKEKLAVDFINKSGVGFFDTFETDSYIESTTATYNKENATVDFGSPEVEQLVYQAVESSDTIELVGDQLRMGDSIKVGDKLITIEEVL